MHDQKAVGRKAVYLKAKEGFQIVRIQGELRFRPYVRNFELHLVLDSCQDMNSDMAQHFWLLATVASLNGTQFKILLLLF